MGAVFFSILCLFSFLNFISTTIYTCDPSISCGCSKASTNVTARIVGGELARNNTWGWMVSLRRSGSHICGATLLTAEYAITASHCVVDSVGNPSELSILVGTNYLYDVSSATVQQRSVIKIVSNPNYDPGSDTNDIAIIQFSPLTISSSSNLDVICLPDANQDPFQIGSDLVAIGWGVTKEGSQHVPSYLRQVTVQVISYASTNYSQIGTTYSNLQFYAGTSTGGKDTCQGDSGGPLMAFVNNRWVLAGVTASGQGCAESGFPGVYTRVSVFIPFINSNTGSSSSDGTNGQNNQQSISKGNGNMIDKSILILMFSFSFFLFFSDK